MKQFIEHSWLELVRGKIFFYPAAFNDCAEPVIFFQDYIDFYLFCDKGYQQDLKLDSAIPYASDFSIVKTGCSGHVGADPVKRIDYRGKTYTHLDPSKLVESYRRSDGRILKIIRRRGYGQMALTKEFKPNTIGVFMHRGDSSGEGGSGIQFLANKTASFEPCGMLFEKLSEKLTDTALIISDGSNSYIPWVSQFHNKSVSGGEAYARHMNQEYRFGKFSWVCVGWLTNRYGPTLIWGLKRVFE
jgi:hypothetical protein